MGYFNGTQPSSPNLWDQTADAKANLLKGVSSIRPVVGQSDYAGNAAAYGGMGLAAQQNAMGLLAAQATGQAPSLANLQMQQGMEANQRAAMSMAANARGGNLQGSMQSALNAGSGAGAMAAQQGAINRIAEQQAALGQYAQMGQSLSQQGLGYAGLGLQSALGQDQNALGWYGAKRGMDLQQRGQDREFIGGLINSGASMVGSLLGGVSAMSDERVKMGLGTLPQGEAGSLVGDVQPVGWDRYSDPSMGNGQPAGVSAQQLQGTRLGGLVHPGADGLLRVDAGGAATTALAASADQEHRLRAMEQHLAQTTGYGTDEQRYGTLAEGQANTRRAQMLSDDIAAQRGAAQVRRGLVDAPRAYDFSGSPQMQRGGFDRGNIDPYSQPRVRNPDGSISTVDSSSYNIGGREMLLPSVTPDGRHLSSADEIVGEYNRTGRHLGSFRSPEAATSYARELHDAYANGAFDSRPIDPRDPQYAAITSQPGRYSSPEFTDSPSPFGPEPVERRGLQPRATARRRRPGLVQVEDAPGAPMRATPVGEGMSMYGDRRMQTEGGLINYDRRAPIEPYRPGSARILGYDEMVGRPRGPLLDPASQEMLDAQHDYLNDYTMEVRDEAGNVRRIMKPQWMRDRMDAPVPVALQRELDQLARDDEARANADERARRAAMPQRAMVL